MRTAAIGADADERMTDSPKPPERFSLSRWSRRKLASARAESAPNPVSSPPRAAAPAGDGTAVPTSPQASEATATSALAPIESLTIDSDFTAFLQPAVDEPVKRAALRKLFSDPHFNVMDGLDVYIDDYSKSEPIPAGIVRTLAQARYVLDPPRTRVNAQGIVEDVPDEETASAVAAANAGQDEATSASVDESDPPVAASDTMTEHAEASANPVSGDSDVMSSTEPTASDASASSPAAAVSRSLTEPFPLKRTR
jgi:hypothetical protein